MTKQEIIAALEVVADDDLLAKIRDLLVEHVDIHQAKLNALKERLSSNGSEPDESKSGFMVGPAEEDEEQEEVTLHDAVERILRTAGKALSKRDIMRRYNRLYGKDVSENSVGGALYKKKGILFERIGTSSRYTKWKLMEEVR